MSKQSNKNKVQYVGMVNKEIHNYIYQLRTKLKHKLEHKTKASYQVGTKAMKLTNMLRGKERKKKRGNGYAKLNRGR